MIVKPEIDFAVPFSYHAFMKSADSIPPTTKRALAIIRKIERFITRYNMLTLNDRVLVAVSGGADSTALLHILLNLRDRHNISLHVAHLNHNLRGAESDGDAGFVQETAKNLGLPVCVETLHKDRLKQRGRAKQDLAREVRYDFLQRVATQAGCTKIATAHTADDTAETVLMALIRGGGTQSLGGIPPVRDNIIRPLLCLDRAEITEFLTDSGLAWREDSSNKKTDYLRNKIRLELIPYLRGHFNPSISATLARTAEVLRDDGALLNAILKEQFSGLLTEDDGTVSIPLKRLEGLQAGAVRRLVREAWQRTGAVAGGRLLTASHIASILQLLQKGTSGDSVSLPGEMTARRGYADLVFSLKATATGVGDDGPWPLPAEGSLSIQPLRITVNVVRNLAQHETARTLWTASFDSSKLSGPLFVRTRRAGDSFRPAGMAGSRKKLQDFLVDVRAPRESRDRIPLVCCGDEIIWVAGYRQDERFLPTPETSSFTTIEIIKEF